MRQNRIKQLHHSENSMEQKRRCSNIPGRLPTNRLPNSLKNWRAYLLIGPRDSIAIGRNSLRDIVIIIAMLLLWNAVYTRGDNSVILSTV